MYQDAVARSEALERETEQRLAELTMSAVTAQQELDAQTAYLRTLRDATRTQMEAFLEGLLDRVAEEYGKAHPLAVEAARDAPRRPRRNTKATVTKGAGTKVNGRPAPQLGRSTGSAAQSGRPAGPDPRRQLGRRALSACGCRHRGPSTADRGRRPHRLTDRLDPTPCRPHAGPKGSAGDGT